MTDILSLIIELLPFLMLLVISAYFFVHARRHKVAAPWGIIVVFLGILTSGVAYYFYDNQVAYFSMDLSLVVNLFGIYLNINNVQSQFQVRNIREFLRFISTGLVSAGLLAASFIVLRGTQYTQIPAGYTKTALISMGVQGAIGEELLFRGYFLGYFRKYNLNYIFSILFQALIFALLHYSLYSSNPMALLIIFLNGALAGYFTWKNSNLIPAIALHMVFNVVALAWWLN